MQDAAYPTPMVWHALAASLRREGLSLSEIATVFAKCGRVLSRSAILRLLDRAAKDGFEVPEVSVSEGLRRFMANPSSRKFISDCQKKRWQNGDHTNELANLVALNERRHRLRNPDAMKRKAFMNSLRLTTSMTFEERVAEADKYFPNPTEIEASVVVSQES